MGRVNKGLAREVHQYALLQEATIPQHRKFMSIGYAFCLFTHLHSIPYLYAIRTDNSIKNHWNSSVKKKLDMYLASGLLSQFQGLPLVSHSNHSAASSSSKAQQSSEDDINRAEMEDASECSQGSIIADRKSVV